MSCHGNSGVVYGYCLIPVTSMLSIDTRATVNHSMQNPKREQDKKVGLLTLLTSSRIIPSPAVMLSSETQG